jgi:hypothetical protein
VIFNPCANPAVPLADWADDSSLRAENCISSYAHETKNGNEPRQHGPQKKSLSQAPERLITAQNLCCSVPKWKKAVLDASTDNGIKLLLRNTRQTLPKCVNETVALSSRHNPNESGGEH